MLSLPVAETSANVWPVSTGLDSSREPDDERLLSSVAGGDRAAFRIFHQRHAGQVKGYLLRVCHDQTVAEDLVQEVFLGVWRQAAGYRRDRGVARAWLFGIVRNKLFDARRRGTIELALLDSGLEHLSVASEPQRDLRLALSQALESLPRSQRQAVAMTYIGGYTYDETAERLAVPLGTLKSRLRAGIKRLRARLGVT